MADGGHFSLLGARQHGSRECGPHLPRGGGGGMGGVAGGLVLNQMPSPLVLQGIGRGNTAGSSNHHVRCANSFVL